MKVYGCQFDVTWEDKQANFRKVRAMLEAKRPQAGSLVLLPEMFATGFSMNVGMVAEDAEKGPTTEFMSGLARSLGIYLVGGYPTSRPDGKARNELAVYGPDGSHLAQYAKIHPFSFGKESQHYVGGSEICRFEWAGAKVSPFICYDLRFPEIFRHAMRGGAEVIAVIANWPLPREEHWITLLRARAIENQAYLVGVNRCGNDPWLSYFGRSLVVDPQGKVIVDGGNEEALIEAEIDLKALRTYRDQFPILSDVRPRFLGL
jgi:predicted amidohydrolase